MLTKLMIYDSVLADLEPLLEKLREEKSPHADTLNIALSNLRHVRTVEQVTPDASILLVKDQKERNKLSDIVKAHYAAMEEAALAAQQS